MKYRKKPIVIEAEQFNPNGGASTDGTLLRTGDMFMEFPVLMDGRGHYLSIPALEGDHRADPGDWIITSVAGEKYPCKDSVFKQTYEPA